MLRINKLSDYATLIMAYLAEHLDEVQSAKAVSQATHVRLPTVSKLLKRLTQAGLVMPQRGVRGGYQLAIAPEKISLAKIIHALEGEIALTECSQHNNDCVLAPTCITKKGWQLINQTVLRALDGITIMDIRRF